MQDLNFKQLGDLIKRCSDAGVVSMKIGDSGVEVLFAGKRFIDDELKGEVVLPKGADLIDQVLKEDDPDDDAALADDMIHLTDPVEWQKRVNGPDAPQVVMTEGEQDDEL